MNALQLQSEDLRREGRNRAAFIQTTATSEAVRLCALQALRPLHNLNSWGLKHLLFSSLGLLKSLPEPLRGVVPVRFGNTVRTRAHLSGDCVCFASAAEILEAPAQQLQT